MVTKQELQEQYKKELEELNKKLSKLQEEQIKY